MSDRSRIEWCDALWNPVRARNLATDPHPEELAQQASRRIGWHCEHVSEGCRNCYAETFNKRLGTGLDYKPGNREAIDIFLDENLLLAPLRWKRPRKIFVGSMTDVFADFVSDDILDKIFAVMALCPQHTFQLLTKRPERMRRYISTGARDLKIHLAAFPFHSDAFHKGQNEFGAISYREGLWFITWPLPNVWLGVSCEDQKTADARIPDLLATPAAKRFISAEPLLGPIDLERVGIIDSIRAAMPDIIKREQHGKPKSGAGSICGAQIDAIGPSGSSVIFFQTPDHMGGFTAVSPREWPCLDWVICGGESGPNARPMHPDWARSLRDQCAAAGVPFFFKQWGEYFPRDEWEHNPDLILPDDDLCREGTSGMTIFLDSAIMHRVGKSRAGRLLDGVEHNAFPPL